FCAGRCEEEITQGRRLACPEHHLHKATGRPEAYPTTMVMKIDRDASRFKQIVRGKIRENLRKYVTHGEMIGRKGNDLVSIPLPQLDVPHFRYGQNGRGGVGQGDGEIGQPIAPGDPDGEGGEGQAGSESAPHVLEVDITLDELAA